MVMGGPMNVDEVDRFPALAAEREWLAEAVRRELAGRSASASGRSCWRGRLAPRCGRGPSAGDRLRARSRSSIARRPGAGRAGARRRGPALARRRPRPARGRHAGSPPRSGPRSRPSATAAPGASSSTPRPTTRWSSPGSAVEEMFDEALAAIGEDGVAALPGRAEALERRARPPHRSPASRPSPPWSPAVASAYSDWPRGGAVAAARPAMTPAISVKSLRKSFGDFEAVRGVDFEVADRRGLRLPRPQRRRQDDDDQHALHADQAERRQSATVAGHDVVAARDEVRRHIGLVFQDPTLDGYLSAAQNLRLHAELYGVEKAAVAPRMRQVLEMVGLWERRDAQVLDLLRRHAAAAGDRPRPDALAAGALPRRADDRARPADAQLDLGLHPPAAGERGDHDLHDHPLHGRGRVLRPDRDHGPRRDRRPRHAARR